MCILCVSDYSDYKLYIFISVLYKYMYLILLLNIVVIHYCYCQIDISSSSSLVKIVVVYYAIQILGIFFLSNCNNVPCFFPERKGPMALGSVALDCPGIVYESLGKT